MKHISLLIIFLCSISMATYAKGPSVQIVTNDNPSAPVNFAIEKLEEALMQNGYTFEKGVVLNGKKDQLSVVIGMVTDKHVCGLATEAGIHLPDMAEGLSIKKMKKGKTDVILVTGFDARGTMYAVLELAAQIEALPKGASLMAELDEADEAPYAVERSLSTYIKTSHVREGFWHDSLYWDALFEQLAESRINYYDIIFKVRPPVYTLFFDVDGWSKESVGGNIIPDDEQARNLKALKRIVEQAHKHGVNITLGIWDHVHNPEDADRLAPYTEEAIAQLVQRVPFDAFQFRMHWESGLPQDPATLKRFWGSVFDGINNSGRHMRIYPRAKGLPNLVIETAAEKNMDFAIETKYMAEQMGMPFHPAHIQVQNQFDRRHGYADLLTYPKRYDILWRSWSWGSQKMLLWGDPEYTRRWVESTSLFNGKGVFEVMQIEGAKPMGNGSVRCLNDTYVYTDYEFQRYWYHNMLYGRLGYNPKTPDKVFEREFIQRFGAESGPAIMEAMSIAGMILPRIIGSAMPDFQEARGVPEWGSGSGLGGMATLAAYAHVQPSDNQTFISFKEAATMLLNGSLSGRVWPQQTAVWHDSTAANILQIVDNIEKEGNAISNKELFSTLTDLKILAGMSHFHSLRIKAAIAYSLYEQLDSSSVALDSAIYWETLALDAYRSVVETVDHVYRTDLDISVSDAGHWRDELKLLETAFEQLKASKVKNQSTMPSIVRNTGLDKYAPQVSHALIDSVFTNIDLDIEAIITDPSGIRIARVYYRGVTQFQDYQVRDMERQGNKFSLHLSADEIRDVVEYKDTTGALWDFMYFIEAIDSLGNGCIYPDFNAAAPYVIAHLPHKTLDETNGKYAYSSIKDKTYTTRFHDRPKFEITSPVNNDVFMSGSDIVVKMAHPWVDPDEKITLYINGEEVQAEKSGELEFTIHGLENGLYKINAFLTKVGLVAWSNTVEIVVGTTRQ